MSTKATPLTLVHSRWTWSGFHQGQRLQLLTHEKVEGWYRINKSAPLQEVPANWMNHLKWRHGAAGQRKDELQIYLIIIKVSVRMAGNLRFEALDCLSESIWIESAWRLRLDSTTTAALMDESKECQYRYTAMTYVQHRQLWPSRSFRSDSSKYRIVTCHIWSLCTFLVAEHSYEGVCPWPLPRNW